MAERFRSEPLFARGFVSLSKQNEKLIDTLPRVRGSERDRGSDLLTSGPPPKGKGRKNVSVRARGKRYG